MCSIELIEYGSILFSSNKFFKSAVVLVFKNSRSFAAQISRSSKPAALAALMSVSKSACIVVAPFNAIFMFLLQVNRFIGDCITSERTDEIFHLLIITLDIY